MTPDPVQQRPDFTLDQSARMKPAQDLRANSLIEMHLMPDMDADPEYPEFRPCVEEGVDLNWAFPLVVWGPPGIGPEIAQAVNAANARLTDDPRTFERLKATNSQFTPHDLAASQALIAGLDDHTGQLAVHLDLSVR
ncbi:hypothetical protein [Roseinatronobacter sp. S2]|uniref:hypothetical protein n=1 Tax=Roseinatronobacter sp. S2 TaxID=3035471 RepID=UPI0024106AB0|nr:hypothetical protein [Roseinatronobacter sp. S2]WFE76704.1 hypothetical protein P8S53_19560 [Roseinatronobacter sp. S2]